MLWLNETQQAKKTKTRSVVAVMVVVPVEMKIACYNDNGDNHRCTGRGVGGVSLGVGLEMVEIITKR